MIKTSSEMLRTSEWSRMTLGTNSVTYLDLGDNHFFIVEDLVKALGLSGSQVLAECNRTAYNTVASLQSMVVDKDKRLNRGGRAVVPWTNGKAGGGLQARLEEIRSSTRMRLVKQSMVTELLNYNFGGAEFIAGDGEGFEQGLEIPEVETEEEVKLPSDFIICEEAAYRTVRIPKGVKCTITLNFE